MVFVRQQKVYFFLLFKIKIIFFFKRSTTKSITAFKNQIQFANSNLDIKHQRIIFQNACESTEIPSLLESTKLMMTFQNTTSKLRDKENCTALYYENSPMNWKKKENEVNRGFLSEQKENNIKKLMNNINEKKSSTQKLFYPLGSPNNANTNNNRMFNSPNGRFIQKDKKDDNKNVSPNQKTEISNGRSYLMTTNNSNQKNNNNFNAEQLQTKENKKNNIKINTNLDYVPKTIPNTQNKFLKSLKNFSDEVISSTANFINSNYNKMSDRKQCTCDIGLNKLESCKNALKWFKSNQTKNVKLNDLKVLYENIQKEKGDEKVMDQIRRDVTRTYSSSGFFNENSNG